MADFAGAATADERRVAHIKRLLELFEGDPDFRQRAADDVASRQDLLNAAGLDLSADALAAFWRMPDVARLPVEAQGDWRREFEQSSYGRLWIAWNDAELGRLGAASARRVSPDPRVRAWRQRRLSRMRSEAVQVEDLSYFPLFAFELSQGCSVQCWFCALDPERLKGHFAYTPEHRALWREVLGHAWTLFGAGAQACICYHGTDPTDNPDFFRFQDDVVETFGVLPQVTTAQPLRNLDWTRTLLDYQRRHPLSHHRFSVLTLGTLRRIHQTFTPEDLLHVSLVLQHKAALGRKVACGRAATRGDRIEAEAEYRTAFGLPADMERQTTCECTCGYLVNMVTGRIQLISPATPSAAAPLGYATHAEGTFRTGEEFRAFLDQTVEAHMGAHLAAEATVRLWDDIRFEPLDDGFRLTSRFRRQTVRGGPHHARLGELLSAGTHTTAEIVDALIREGMPPLDAAGWLDRVYQTGAIAES